MTNSTAGISPAVLFFFVSIVSECSEQRSLKLAQNLTIFFVPEVLEGPAVNVGRDEPHGTIGQQSMYASHMIAAGKVILGPGIHDARRKREGG